MTIGEKIQALRKQKGLSQKQVADMVLVSHQAVSRWEQGESIPDVDNVLRLSEIFGVSTDYLLKDILEKAQETGGAENEDKEPQKEARANFDFESDFGSKKKHKNQNFIVSNAYNIAAVAYLIMGFTMGWWHPGWIVFLVAGVVQGYRSLYSNAYNIAVVVFLVLGFAWNIWSVAWVVFPLAWLLRRLTRDYRENKRDGDIWGD